MNNKVIDDSAPSSSQLTTTHTGESETPDFDRRQAVEQADALLRLHNTTAPPETSSDLFFDLPIVPRTILLLGLGSDVRGNMLAILDELNTSPRFAAYHIFVRTSEATKDRVDSTIETRNWHRTQSVTDGKDYVRVLNTAEYLATETCFPLRWVKKPGQTLIMLWHGTPLKKLGSDKNYRCNHSDGIKQRDFINADYILCPNRFTQRHLLEAYRVNNLATGKVALSGYPRTGTLLNTSTEKKEHLEKLLAPHGETLYAYMPTWKDYLEIGEVLAESVKLLDCLDRGLDDREILYVNLHHKVGNSIDYSKYQHIRPFPASVDSYELLSVTEGLITDYSSIFFDYLATRKQIVLYCPDVERYQSGRGTYLDLLSLPFDKAFTTDAVLDALHRGKTYDDAEAFLQFNEFDSAENARKICSLFLESPDSDMVIEDIKGNQLPNVLLFNERCGKGTSTKRLKRLVKIIDRKVLNLHLGCEKNRIEENKDFAYPLLFANPTIGVDISRTFPTARGRALQKLSKKGIVGFPDTLPYLKHDYALMAQRLLGHANYQLIVIYDVCDPLLILTLASHPAPKILFLTKELIDALIAPEDSDLKSAILYAAARANTIAVANEVLKRRALKALPDNTCVSIVRSARSIDRFIRKALRDGAPEGPENR